MLPEDRKRLERERSIAKATMGPDYSQFEKAVRAVKAEHGKRVAAQRETDLAQHRGYLRMVRRGKITNSERARPVHRPTLTPEL